MSIQDYQRYFRFLAALSLIAGLTLLLPLAFYWSRDQLAAAKAMNGSGAPVAIQLPEINQPETIKGRPTELNVPSLGITLSVVDGKYDPMSGQWMLSDDKAHFAEPSVIPNNKAGNTLIYGHNKPGVFDKLTGLKPGAKLRLRTVNGYEFTYVYREKRTVAPTNVEIFGYQGVPQLTVQTCSGTWYQNREFFFFDLQEVTSID